MDTDRSFMTFSTDAMSSGQVFDETFREHAAVVLGDVRQRLIDEGWSSSEPEDHSFYGVKIRVRNNSGRDIEMLLQAADEWLLILSLTPTFFERVMGRRNDRVPSELVEAVASGLVGAGAQRLRRFTRSEFENRLPEPRATSAT